MFFSKLLTALEVRHTRTYSDGRFMHMPFMSWFGLSKLLDEYGIDSQGVIVSDTAQMCELPVPFVAQLKCGEWVIVTEATKCHARYITQSVREDVSITTLADDWTGKALLTRPRPGACEPDYGKHLLAEVMTRLRNCSLIALLAGLPVWSFIANGLWRHWYMWVLTLIYLFGLSASVGLVLKELGVKSRALDNVCAAVVAHGCETVMGKGGTFLGIFHWSQVGLAYFSVSLTALLAFPAIWPWLALTAVCCLPYSFWSVSYQKWVAKSWCTLCLCVQASFWLLFFFWIPVEWWHELEWTPGVIVLLAAYGVVLLSVNALMPLITLPRKDE